MKNMTEVKNNNTNKFEHFKKVTKDLYTSKGFDLFSDFSRAFEELSLEEKIDAFNYIKALPTSQRKTLLFSAFVKQKKKAVSREINQMGFLI